MQTATSTSGGSTPEPEVEPEAGTDWPDMPDMPMPELSMEDMPEVESGYVC